MTKEQVILILNRLNETELISVWNKYCNVQNCLGVIYDIDYFDVVMADKKAMEIIDLVDISEFNVYDNYIQNTKDGWISFTNVIEHMNIDDLAYWIMGSGIEYFADFADECVVA